MRNVRVTIWVMVCICCFGLPRAVGEIVFDDGGIHDITYLVNEDILVDFGSPGVRTTVNVLDGANLLGVSSYEDSIINMSGGIGFMYIANENSVINISGGLTYFVESYDNSRVNISGGSEILLLWTADNSTVTIFGTHFNYGLGPIPNDSGRLTGMLQNGDPLDVDFVRFDNASIVLVPEPATLLLLGLGGLMLGRKR